MTDSPLERHALAIEKATEMLAALCEGRRKFLMSIPARPDDPDLVLSDGLDAGSETLAYARQLELRNQHLERERDEARAQVAGLKVDLHACFNGTYPSPAHDREIREQAYREGQERMRERCLRAPHRGGYGYPPGLANGAMADGYDRGVSDKIDAIRALAPEPLEEKP